MTVSRFALALSIALFCVSCSSPAPLDPPTAEGPSGAECQADSTLTYGNFAADFFSSYCIRCHDSALSGADRNGAPGNRNYDTLSGLVETGSMLIDQAAAAGPSRINTFMPPSAPRPSDAERRQLGEWLAWGMQP
jgi:hypothetical protein